MSNYNKPTHPASHDAVYGPGSAPSLDAAHMLMTGSMPEKVSLASHDAGESKGWVYQKFDGGTVKDFVLASDYATLTAEVSRLTGELAEVREQSRRWHHSFMVMEDERHGLRDDLERSRQECEGLREALREIAELMTTNPEHMARIAGAALSATGREGRE